MKNQAKGAVVDKKKTIAIVALFAVSIIIIAMGASFSVISLINNVSFKVLNSSVHGAVFGVVIAFLGVRYFLSVRKLKQEVYKKTSKFSWNNFKKDKTHKNFSKADSKLSVKI